MGFLGNIGHQIKALFGVDKEARKRDLARGATVSSSVVGYGRDMMQAFGYDVMANYLSTDNDLLSRYSDYEAMDDDAYIASALDIIAEDTTQPSPETKKAVWVKSKDKTVELILDKDLLERRLNMEDEIWTMARTLGLYGSDFEEILVDNSGVVGLNYLPAPTMRRIEGPHGDLYGYIQDYRGKYGFSPTEFMDLLRARNEDRNRTDAGTPVGSIQRTDRPRPVALENWEVVHFRLPGKYRRTTYGLSILESSRWHFKRMALLEDAALLYRLQRAPERFAFYVDVGDLPPQEALAYLNKVRQMYKKKRFLDPTSGRLNLKWESLPVAHDTPIPLLDGRIIPISQLSAEHKQGIKHWVYSVDRCTGHIVPGLVSWVDKTRSCSPAIKITFDDGGSAVMAPDHAVMRRDLSYVKAEDLQVGDSIMPLYRRLSSKSRGHGLEGYEQVYNPVDKCFRYTHALISNHLYGDLDEGVVTHHVDCRRLNNEPENLQRLPIVEHLRVHRELGWNVGRAISEKRKIDPELDLRLREAARRTISAFNRSPRHHEVVVASNKNRDQAAIVRRYNSSPEHSKSNAIRCRSKKEMWADPIRRARAIEKMKVHIPPFWLDIAKKYISSSPESTLRALVDIFNARSAIEDLRVLNPTDPPRSVHRHMLRYFFQRCGYSSFEALKNAATPPNNHTVAKVERVDPTDHYCMTVDKWHNFALNLKDSEGNVLRDSGVFVKNSPDDDFWIPVRQGQQGARVEVLGAPSWQCLVGDTSIPLLNGTSKTISQMAEEGGTYWVYSCTPEGRVIPGKAHSARITHDSADIWEVGLDSGEVVACTDNHPFLTKSGEWVLARDLQPGHSLMPFNKEPLTDGWVSEDQIEYAHHRTYLDSPCLINDLKVVSVCKTARREPVYDLTVDSTHCFALSAGVFVHNSTVDLEYFRDKIFAAIKVPKSYLGQEQGVARSTLSSEDVRFARLILRVQRTMCSGVRQICRTHLAAIGVIPDNVEYDVHMQVPSAIYQLAQMEVQNARTDLALRLKEFMSEYWIYTKVFGLSDDEVQQILDQRAEDMDRNSTQAAQAQGKAMQIQQAMTPAPPPDQGGAPAPPPSGGAGGPGGQPRSPMTSAPALPAAESLEDLVKGTFPSYTIRAQGRNLERDLMRGDRAGERRAERKLDEILLTDRKLADRLVEVKNLLLDISSVRGHPR